MDETDIGGLVDSILSPPPAKPKYGGGELDDLVDAVLNPDWHHQQLAAEKASFGTEPLYQRAARKAVPFGSAIGNVLEDQEYKAARDRFHAGVAGRREIGLMADYEARREADANRGFGGKVADVVLSAPAVIGEAAATGGIGPAAGESALGFVAKKALQAQVMPSMTLEGASRRSVAQGGEPYSPQNLAPAAANAAVTNIIFGSLGPLSKGVTNPAARIAAGGATFGLEKQALDALAGAADEVLPKAYQTGTRYGVIGKMLHKEYGEGLQEAALDAVTGAIFAAAHALPGRQPDPVGAFRDSLNESARRGLPANAAAEAARRAAAVEAARPETPPEQPAQPEPAPETPQAPPAAAEPSPAPEAAPKAEVQPQGPPEPAAGPPPAEPDERMVETPAGTVPESVARAMGYGPKQPQAPPPEAPPPAKPGEGPSTDTGVSVEPPGGFTPPEQRRIDTYVRVQLGRDLPPEAVDRAEREIKAKVVAERGPKLAELWDRYQQTGDAGSLKDIFDAGGLTARERRVIQGRLDGRPLADLGREMGFTRERARQVEADARAKLGVKGSLEEVSVKPGAAGAILDRAERGEFNVPEDSLTSWGEEAGGEVRSEFTAGRRRDTALVNPSEVSGQFDPVTGKRLAKANRPPPEEGARAAARLVRETLRGLSPGEAGELPKKLLRRLAAVQSTSDAVSVLGAEWLKEAERGPIPPERQSAYDAALKRLSEAGRGAEGRPGEAAREPAGVPEGTPQATRPAPGEGRPAPEAAPERAPAADQAGVGEGADYLRLPGQRVGTGGPRPQPAPPSGQDLLPAATGGLRELGAERQRRYDVAKAKLGSASREFDDLVRAAGPDKAKLARQFLDWTNPGEAGQVAAMPAGALKDAARAVRDLYDERRPELARLGLVKNFIDNYLGHLWKDPANPNATPDEIAGRIDARRSFAGPEGFRKERKLPTFADGFAAGLEPLTWNPVEMQLLRLRELDKSITAHANFGEMEGKGAFDYFPLGKRLPQGWSYFSDKMGKVFAPPVKDMTEFVDKRLMEGLESFAAKEGIPVRTSAAGPVGMSDPSGVTRRFGSPEEVLAHEIVHQIDRKYGLHSLAQNPSLQPELKALADLRASGQVSPQYQAYLRSEPELVPNLFYGMLHAPELTEKTAPNALAAFKQLLGGNADLRPLLDVKPSLELDARGQAVKLAGPQLVGNYAGPREVIDLYDRFLSPGLGGSALYRGIRGAGNTVNQFNLGLSAWHATGVSLNSVFSGIGLGLKKISRGDFASGAGDILASPAEPIRNYLGGRAGKAEWLAPGTQGAAMADDIARVVEAGGRLGMDQFDKTSHLEAMRGALADLKAGNALAALKGSWAGTRLVPALAEFLNKPTMEYWVPQVKLGAALRAMRYEADWAARRGVAMDADMRRERFGKIWDSMDDRFGQLVYDNLFWHRTVKDAATAAVRAVGWNVGTVRAYGGAVKDVPSSLKGVVHGEGVSDRLAFGVASVFGAAMIGGLTQALLTGKRPDDLNDLVYPRTGGTNRDGTAERLSFPTYLNHDIAPLFNRADEGPFRWLQNMLGAIPGKANPILTVPIETFGRNEDWQGRAIRDPNDPIKDQARDVFAHLLKSLEPFSIEGAGRAYRRGAPPEQVAATFFGVTPAGYKAEHAAEEQRAAESGRKIQLTPLEKRRRGLR